MTADRHYWSARPLGDFRGGTLQAAGWRRAEGDARWRLFVSVKGAGLDGRLGALTPPRGDAIIGAVPGGAHLANKRMLWIRLVQRLGAHGAAELAPRSWLPDVARDRERLRSHLARHPGETVLVKHARKQRREGIRVHIGGADLDLDALAVEGKGALVVQQAVPDVLRVAGQRTSVRRWVVLVRAAGRVSAWLHRGGLVVTSGSADGWIALPSADQTGEVDWAGLRARLPDPTATEAGIHRCIAAATQAVLRDLGRPALREHACAELFGVDFVLQASGRPWMLEWNRMPRVRPRSEVEVPLRTALLTAPWALAGAPGFGAPGAFDRLGTWDLPPVAA